MYRKERYLLMCTECNLFFPPSQFRYHVPQFRMCESCRLLNLDIVNYLERYVYTPRLLCCYSSFENRLDRIHRKCLALEKELDDLKERFARRDEEKACRKIYEVVNKKEEENNGNENQDLKIKMKIVKKKNHKKVKFEVEENANQEETMQQVSPPKKIKLENMDGVEEEKEADEKEKKNPSKEEDDEMKEKKDVDNEKEQNVEEMVEQIIDEILKKIIDLNTENEDENHKEATMIMNEVKMKTTKKPR